jgi:ABC-type glutathione transport system ATPase component
MTTELLSVENVTKSFPIKSGLLGRTTTNVAVLDNISLRVFPGETFGIAGESGAGKTVLLKTIGRLLRPTSGKIYFEGTDLTALRGEDLRRTRKQIQMVFQDPVASLHPRMTIGQTLVEPLNIHNIGSKRERVERVEQLLEFVGLNPAWRTRYPHQFSGGQRQRVGVARALMLQPKLILCDEPVSALDVSLQAQVLNLFLDLQEQLNLTYIFVAHDLAVMKQLCDRIAIIRSGRIVELAPADRIYECPQHPYTKRLLSASPSIEKGLLEDWEALKIDFLSAEAIECPFHEGLCTVEGPQLIEIAPGHWVNCFLL